MAKLNTARNWIEIFGTKSICRTANKLVYKWLGKLISQMYASMQWNEIWKQINYDWLVA